MDPVMFQVLYPIWVGIAFNLLMTVFNLVGMAVKLEGPFVEWYLERKGCIKIMVGSWIIFIGWAITNGVVASL